MDDHPPRATLSPDGTQYYDGPDWGWQDLWLTPDRVLAFCAEERGLPVTRVALLTEGLLNQTWKIECADHDRVLRVGRSERTPDQVAYERRVARAWADVAPVVVAAEHDDVPVIDGHTLTLFPYVEGYSGTTVPSPVRCRELVPVLAAMHRAALTLGLGQRPGFGSVDDPDRGNDWDHARREILERFGHGAEVLEPVTVVDRAIAELERQLDDWTRSGRLAVRAPVHADLNPRNQLYRDDRLVAIIDTDDLRIEPLIWEVANLAYTDTAVEPDQVWQAYLAAGGPLDPADHDLLLPLARSGVLGEIEWLTDADGRATHLALDSLRNLARTLTGRPTRDA